MDLRAFDYIRPTERQTDIMTEMRGAAAEYAKAIEIAVPNGPDKTHIMRRLREIAMWINVAVTRNDDGSPRTD
jgi:hypothetical protein